jgi:RNA polymerase sigma-70 factor (ECF subfamily)
MTGTMAVQQDVAPLLAKIQAGNPHAAQELLVVVYDELRQRAGALMRRERGDHTLQPTALVHEALLELIPKNHLQWTDRAHFFAVVAQTMRRILVEHARTRNALKRGGKMNRIPSDCLHRLSAAEDQDILAIEKALAKLTTLNARHAEIVSMRFFGGLTVEEVAAIKGVPKRTLEAEWSLIKAWLRHELTHDA